MENCLKVEPTHQTIALRNLQTIGERIRSHATHLYFLALPDYLGYESALSLPKKFKNDIARALRLMRLGNDIIKLTTGRMIHPISPTIGGFLHFPKQEDPDVIRDRLENSNDDIIKTAKLFSSIKYPDFERPTKYMSIVKDDEFATSYGNVQVGEREFHPGVYHKFVKEYHEPFSTANFVVKDKKAYSSGALARFVNNSSKYSEHAKPFLKNVNMNNPFHNNICQAIELVHYRDECIKLLDSFTIDKEEIAKFDVKEGHGIAPNEAPRGTLWHEYRIDNKGIITKANIVTPTAQFLRNLNEDIKAYVQQLLNQHTPKDKLVLEIEKLIRSYDPCFSCSTHFLKVNWI